MNATDSIKIKPAVISEKGEICCHAVIFDLDGTLVDTGCGIKNSIRKTIEVMALPPKTDEELDKCIGPPLRAAFRQFLHIPEENISKAVQIYRAFYYQSGIYEAHVYDGIPQLLKDLRGKGYQIAVGTSKAWVLAHRILRHFELRPDIDGVFGCYRDGRLDDKAQVLQAILDHYSGKKRLAPGRLGDRKDKDTSAYRDRGGPHRELRLLMVGDRYYDIEGARAVGLPAIGVTFGYGTAKELKDAGAALIVDHPAEISGKLPLLQAGAQ